MQRKKPTHRQQIREVQQGQDDSRNAIFELYKVAIRGHSLAMAAEERSFSLSSYMCALVNILVTKGLITEDEINEALQKEAAVRALDGFFHHIREAHEARFEDFEPEYPDDARIFG